jgi:hypothetical protein
MSPTICEKNDYGTEKETWVLNGLEELLKKINIHIIGNDIDAGATLVDSVGTFLIFVRI